MTRLFDFAKQLVLDCGEELRQKRREGAFSIREKAGHSDIVTDHDVWVQQYLCRQIVQRYPEHGIVGEEDMCRAGTSRWQWVIDPIDGTTNYCQFGRDYAISVALLYDGQPVYGLVLDVAQERLYEGGAAPQQMPPDCRERAQDGILHMGFKTMRELSGMGADPYALCAQFRGVRYLGCASLELCGIADAPAGVYVNSHLKLWDFAAAYVILRSRGCHFAAAALAGGSYFVCACHSPLLYRQCMPFFPDEAQRKLNEMGGNIFHATNL